MSKTMTDVTLDPPHAPQVPVQPAPVQTKNRWQWYGWLIGLLLIVGIGGTLLFTWLRPHPFHGLVLQSPDPATDFTLTASTGKPLSLSDFRGKTVLLYFGYTACPDACPLTLADLTQTLQSLGKKADQVQVIFITVDPAHDTPQRLAQYLAAFNKTFLGMTGSPDAISAAATQFGIYFDAPTAQNGQAAALVTHTSSVFVIDRAGYVRLLFPNGTPPADMADDLAYLIGR
jgi:protein SCO1/2